MIKKFSQRDEDSMKRLNAYLGSFKTVWMAASSSRPIYGSEKK
jgi:hypothetical protein